MSTDFFTSLLEEIGTIIDIELKPDVNNSCLFKFPTGVKVQIEIDRSGDSLLIGTDIGEIPAGKYRENLFREALKSNGLPYPRYGTFAYSKQLEHLIMFELMPLKNLSGHKVTEMITPFAAKAKLWLEAIAKGDLPQMPEISTDDQQQAAKKVKMFGLEF